MACAPKKPIVTTPMAAMIAKSELAAVAQTPARSRATGIQKVRRTPGAQSSIPQDASVLV